LTIVDLQKASSPEKEKRVVEKDYAQGAVVEEGSGKYSKD
jgi:hypothetical protein